MKPTPDGRRPRRPDEAGRPSKRDRLVTFAPFTGRRKTKFCCDAAQSESRSRDQGTTPRHAQATFAKDLGPSDRPAW